MELDEQSRALLDMQAQQHLDDELGETNKAMDFNDPEQERENFKQVALALARPTLPVGKVEDITVPSEDFDCPVRLYWPEGASADDKRACIVLLHGGGWVVGTLDTHEGHGEFVAREPQGPVSRALSSWKALTAPRPVERSGIPASGV